MTENTSPNTPSNTPSNTPAFKFDFSSLPFEDRQAIIDEFAPEIIDQLALTNRPWTTQPTNTLYDEDGFPINPNKHKETQSLQQLQASCWEKVQNSPHLSGYVNDTAGKICGNGFSIDAFDQRIQTVVDEILTDPRNDFILNTPMYISRHLIEGELFLPMTIHPDAFCEIDFIDPAYIKGGSEDNTGIISHPTKPQVRLAYIIERPDKKPITIPSTYLLHYPNAIKLIPKQYRDRIPTTTNRKYKKINNIANYMIEWKRGYVTKRNLSQIKSTLEWLNYYELMKKIEVDYKRSATSYLWVVKFEDKAAFRLWMSMTEEEQRRTGLMAQKSPGGQLILPPGMTISCEAPRLSTITDEDRDLLHFVTAGLGVDASTLTGDYNANTYASAKMARTPLSDRISAYATYFERFIKYELFRSVFIAKNIINGTKIDYKVKQVVKFLDKEPRSRNVIKKAWELIDVSFPLDDVADLEAKAKAFLGSKHGSLPDTLGISKETIAKRLGFGAYAKEVYKYWSEKEYMPDLPVDEFRENLVNSDESAQTSVTESNDSGVEDAEVPGGE